MSGRGLSRFEITGTEPAVRDRLFSRILGQVAQFHAPPVCTEATRSIFLQFPHRNREKTAAGSIQLLVGPPLPSAITLQAPLAE